METIWKQCMENPWTIQQRHQQRPLYTQENVLSDTNQNFMTRSRCPVSKKGHFKSVHNIGTVCRVQFEPAADQPYDGYLAKPWTGILRASIANRSIEYDDPKFDWVGFQKDINKVFDKEEYFFVKDKFSIAIKIKPDIDVLGRRATRCWYEPVS